MGDPKQVVAQGYDMVAEAYADWGQGAKHPTKQRFVSMARRLLPNGGVAIDLGCGTGEHVTAELAEHFDTTGVDISAHRIDLARQRVPSARFLVADMTAVDFPYATVDPGHGLLFGHTRAPAGTCKPPTANRGLVGSRGNSPRHHGRT